MNILAIDSITAVLSITAYGPAGKVTLSVNSDGRHAENMIPTIDRCLAQAGFLPRETGLVVCAEGPGSFTGLRLAYAAVKAIQLASLCPLMPVPPLPRYAEPFRAWPGVVLSVIDAKKQRFYVQVFRRGGAVTEALDLNVTDAMGYLDSDERILITGPDAELFSETLKQEGPNLDVYAIPMGQNGISDRMAEFAQCQFPNYTERMPDHCGPVYVRKSDAETNRAE